MECSQARKIIYEIAGTEADIPIQLRDEFKKHLAVCSSCAAHYHALISRLEDLRELPRLNAPANFLENVRRRIENPGIVARARNSFFRFFGEISFYRLAATAAAAVLVVVTAQIALKEAHLQKEVSAPLPLPSPAMSPPPAPTESFQNLTSDAPQPAPPLQGESSVPKAGSVPKELRTSAAPQRAKQGAGNISQYNSAPGRASPPANAYPASGEEEEQRKTIRLNLRVPRDSYSLLGKSTAPAMMDKAKEPSAVAGTSLAEKSLARPGLDKEYAKREDRVEIDSADRAMSEVKSLVLLSKGKITSEQPVEDAEKKASISVEIPAQNYAAFLDQLRRFGEVTIPGESTGAAAPQAGMHIRVLILFDTGS